MLTRIWPYRPTDMPDHFSWHYINSVIRRADGKPWSADEKIGRDTGTLK